MEIEYTEMEQEFSIAVVGVTKENRDGSSRQSIIKNSNVGGRIKLVREYDNQYDPNAVAVLTENDEQIGYLPKGDRLAHHIDSGGRVSAILIKKTGGPGLVGKILGNSKKNYGCVIQIKKGSYDWETVTPFMEESREIEELLREARNLEQSNPELSIDQYQDAVIRIIALDAKSRMAAAWRRARHPVNRLSLMLEKSKSYEEALAVISEYERKTDVFGLTVSEEESVKKRKLRLEKRLNKKHS